MTDCIEVGIHSLLLLSARSLRHRRLLVFGVGIILKGQVVHVAADARVGSLIHVHRVRTVLLSTLDQGYLAVLW